MIDISSRYGGMSDNDVIGSQSQYSYGQGLDGKTNPDGLRLARSSQTPNISTGTHLMYCQFDNFYFFGEGGRVYNSSGANIYTLPGNHTIRNVIKFGDNFLMFYNTGGSIRIARCPISGNTPNFGSVTLQRGVNQSLTPFSVGFDAGVGPYCTAINDSDDILYFIADNSVYRIILSLAPFIEKAITLEDKCVGLTKNGSQIAIYLQMGRKYFWDGFSKQHDGYVDLGEEIRYVYDTRNYDYIVAGTFSSIYSKLFVSQGQDFQMIKQGSFMKDGNSEFWKGAYGTEARFGNFPIAVDEQNVYLLNTYGYSMECIGNRVIGLESGSSIDWFEQDVQLFGLVYRSTSDRIGIGYKGTDNNAYIAFVDYFRTPNPRYVEQGVLYTQKYIVGGTFKQRMREYRFRYHCPNGSTIRISYAIDGSDTFELLKELPVTKETQIYSVNSGLPFYEIKYKIEFIRGSAIDTQTPILYSMIGINEAVNQ